MKKLALLCVALVGCASVPDIARQAVTTAVGVISQATDGLTAYDAEHQQKIIDDGVKAGKSKAQIVAELQAWRTKRGEVLKALQHVWDVVTVVATTIPLVESGVKKSTDLTKWVADLWASLKSLKDALSNAGVPLGPLSAVVN